MFESRELPIVFNYLCSIIFTKSQYNIHSYYFSLLSEPVRRLDRMLFLGNFESNQTEVDSEKGRYVVKPKM